MALSKRHKASGQLAMVSRHDPPALIRRTLPCAWTWRKHVGVPGGWSGQATCSVGIVHPGIRLATRKQIGVGFATNAGSLCVVRQDVSQRGSRGPGGFSYHVNFLKLIKIVILVSRALHSI